MQKEMEKKMQPQHPLEQKGQPAGPVDQKGLQTQRSTGQKELQTQRSTGQKELHSMGTAIRPVERHGMEAVKFFLYDPKEGRILGRTPKSWALITVFYTVYYSLLAAFWALCFFIFYTTTIDEQVPRWNGKDWNGSGRIGKSPALIGQSPALGIRPNQTDAHIESSMIMYNYKQEADDKENKIPGYGGWVTRSKEFLETYKDCENNTDLFCAEKELGDCTAKSSKEMFGWDEGKPCIFLKLNKIFGLKHAYYNQTSNSSLPGYISKENETRKEEEKDFPEAIIKYLNEDTTDENDKNQVWVNCKGENVADQENIGELDYFPKSRGFNESYNMYDLESMNAGYRSPLVAIKFKNPEYGVLLHVECRAWAKNIGYNHMDRIGKAHFEMIIYDNDHKPLTVGNESILKV